MNNDYPDNWAEIAQRIKAHAGWRCERCDTANDFDTRHVLTVHHLDGDKSNCAEWNLAALCQRCHLKIQARVEMRQGYMFEHSDWMKPHVDGRQAALAGCSRVQGSRREADV